ncbi:MAG TPA: acetyl-CoA carboxylase, carboxyltransferase subunit beta [Candidatus Hydrogenedentes bacterium]|nr:acetyl-CoA carboxylase, carboxyltransferase subunit beta [Candidatus Hydrogenedentota bacterium]
MSLFRRKNLSPSETGKNVIPDGLWMKCDGCGQTVFKSEVEENLRVCPLCGYHYRLTVAERIRLTLDPDSFQETHADLVSTDPLGFTVGKESYARRLQRARETSGNSEAIVTGFASLEGMRIAVGIMDPDFIMGSMGAVVGEKICLLVEDAIREKTPVLVFAASGGARMQEGIVALMQMARTAEAVGRLNEAAIPYISVLTDPTTGGVYASFASLGDLVIAEPGAYIGFAGKRLIEGALKTSLPEGFQRAEFHLQNGFLDAVVKRSEMRAWLARAFRLLAGSPGYPGFYRRAEPRLSLQRDHE